MNKENKEEKRPFLKAIQTKEETVAYNSIYSFLKSYQADLKELKNLLQSRHNKEEL